MLAATRKNAAEEKSAGTSTSVALQRVPAVEPGAARARTSIGQPNAASMRSV